MESALYINGRFLAQPLSGVQRFATEMTVALRRIHGSPTTVLAPPGASAVGPGVKNVGHRNGHLWEQIELPRYVGRGVLLNLGNTGPLMQRRQAVVVHDAGVFRVPAAYSWKFRASYKLAQRWMARRTTQIVTVSEFSRRELAACLQISADRIAVVSEGADHMHAVADEPGILSEHGLEDGKFVLVVGNLAPHKNLGALGDLARRLAVRDIPLVVIGGLPPTIFQGAERDRLPQPARYLGRVSDGALKALYRTATCFVFPSLYEGFGLPAIEAMACSCPVVAADIPALRETCGDAAQYCDPASPGDIATQVLRVIDDPDLRDCLRRAGYARSGELTWDRAARALDKVLLTVMAAPVPSAAAGRAALQESNSR